MGAIDAEGLVDLADYSPKHGAAMSRRFEDKIIRGKLDVDMVDVLASSHGGVSKVAAQREVRLSKEAWVEAWRLVAHVLVSHFAVPQRVVDGYQTLMEQIFDDYRHTYPQGPAKYDALYRAKAATLFRASNRLPNFKREAVIFNQVFAGKRVATCSMCGSPDHLPRACPLITGSDHGDGGGKGGGGGSGGGKGGGVGGGGGGGKGDKGAKGKGRKNPHGACFDHNKGDCKRDTCRFKHVCSKCGDAGHIATACPKG